MEARSWSPVSEARGRWEQPGECWIRSVKSPLSCSRTFHGSHLPCDSQTRWVLERSSQGGSQAPRTHSLPLQDEESCVPQHTARGWCKGYWGPGEGETGAPGQGWNGGPCWPGAKGGDRLALGAGVVVGMDQRTDRMDGWLYLGSGVDMRCSRCSGQLAGRVGALVQLEQVSGPRPPSAPLVPSPVPPPAPERGLSDPQRQHPGPGPPLKSTGHVPAASARGESFHPPAGRPAPWDTLCIGLPSPLLLKAVDLAARNVCLRSPSCTDLPAPPRGPSKPLGPGPGNTRSRQELLYGPAPPRATAAVQSARSSAASPRTPAAPG